VSTSIRRVLGDDVRHINELFEWSISVTPVVPFTVSIYFFRLLRLYLPTGLLIPLVLLYIRSNSKWHPYTNSSGRYPFWLPYFSPLPTQLPLLCHCLASTLVQAPSQTARRPQSPKALLMLPSFAQRFSRASRTARHKASLLSRAAHRVMQLTRPRYCRPGATKLPFHDVSYYLISPIPAAFLIRLV
jgi:hypothetical protein